ncbi:hypothetical protein H4582DRAFT_2052677 [Lactarius indigo]|nr:hypothetical protein H4582DRAFT_2052677 [Lactarius indigo]
MSFPSMNAQGPESTFEGTSEGYCVLSFQNARIMEFVCNQLLQILDSDGVRYFLAFDFNNLGTYVILPQLDLVHLACYRLLRVLGPLGNISNAAQLGENQVLVIYPQITLTVPQFIFVWKTYLLLLQVDRSFDESNVTQLEAHKVIRDFAICQIDQLLQVYGVLPGELGEHQVPGDNASQVQCPTDIVQLIDAQDAGVLADSDTSSKLPCPEEGCRATFKRQQELNRHTIDVHSPPHGCPFCTTYSWSRPNKIKDHLMTKHQDKHQVLDEIRAKRGNIYCPQLATFPEVVQNIQQ